MRSFFTILILLTIKANVFSQDFRGKVIDVETQEPIPFAQIYFPDLEIGTTTNLNGEFVIEHSLPQVVKITIHSTGYADYLKEINTTQTKELIVSLKEEHLELDELVVSCHTGTLQKSTITNIENKSMDELSVIQATNLGEALNNIPGVYNNSMGNGISKPVIRGLSGVRVVTYLNELRIENQQWGGDHGMGITELGIGNVEIIKGPASLLYGSDALGGVAYFRDEQFADINSKEFTASTRFESNSLKTVNNIGFKYSKNKFRINLFGGYNLAADYKMGNNYYAKNSRFNSQNFKTSIGYNNKNWVLNVRYNFNLNNIGIPGHTHDTLATLSSFQTTKQEWRIIRPAQKIMNSYLMVNNKFFFAKSDLNISVGNTINSLREFEKLTIPAINLSLISTPYNIRYRKVFSDKLNLITGLQGMYQINSNGTDAEEVLIPNSNLLDNGLYAILRYDSDKWGTQVGVRGDNRKLTTYQTDIFSPFNANYNSLNYSAGVYRKVKNIDFRLNYSSGYRAPHVTELLANGVHHSASQFEIGKRDLKPEFAQQIDLGIEFKGEHLSLLINPFFNNLSNYIYIQPTDSVIDGYKVFKYSQANSSFMYGGDIGFHFHPHFAHKFHFESSYSYIKTEDENGNAFPLTPQPRLNSSLSYEFENEVKKIEIKNISVQHQYYFAQNNVAQFETPTAAYHLINVGVNLVFGKEKQFGMKAGVNNLLNQEYIPHLSRLKNIGLFSPGRNIYVSIKYQLKTKNKQ